MSTTIIWGVGGLAFMLLCCLCLYTHVPRLSVTTTRESLPEQLTPTSLDARLLDGKVTLRGTLPDLAAKNQLLARAREVYGEGNLVADLRVNRQSVFPSARWLNHALDLLPLATKASLEGGFVLDGKTLTLRGMVETAEARAKLLREASSVAGTNLRIEDKLTVKGRATTPPASDFQARLNQILAGKIVEFDAGSDQLTARGKEVLDELAAVLSSVPGVPVEIGGHTDARGKPQENQSLSQRRAQACLQYLGEKGVDSTRLSAKGYGAIKPIADNNTVAGQQRNRRIEFTVLQERR